MIQRLLKLFRLFRPGDWLRFGLIVVMMLGAALLELVGLGAVPLFVAVAIDPALAQRNATAAGLLNAVGAESPAEILLWGSAVLLAFFLCRTLYLVASYYIQDRIVRNREVELTCRLLEAYLRAPYAYHLSHNSTLMLRTILQEVNFVIAEVLGPLLNVLRQGVVMLTVVAVVLWREPVVGLLTFTCLGASGLGFLLTLNSRLKWRGGEEHEMRTRQYKIVSESLAVLKEARVLGRTDYFAQQFHGTAERLARVLRFTDTARRSTWPAMELIVVAVLLLAAALMINSGRPLQSLMPVLALFTVALARLKGCAAEFVAGLTQIRYRLVSVDAVYGDLAALEAPPAQAAATPRRPPAVVAPMLQGIELRRVSFRYAQDRAPAVRDVSLRIPRGASVAFVGPTGSGKTTLVDLIIGLLEPQDGAILVDGKDIRTDTQAWQPHLGYIPQAIVLLDDTVARNIALGLPDGQIDPAALQAAITAAQLQDTVTALPQGVNTIIGERGVRLSGGQRQRIGIARALYHNPDVLIMDEGTSALDSGTEQAVIAAIDALKGERTLIMIAHRLSTVRACDVIYCIVEGRAEASGTYQELLVSYPRFAQLTGLNADPNSGTTAASS
jgi:ATP-binding cassette subfamily C protein